MKLNIEEINLLCIFDTSSKEAAIRTIEQALPDMEHEELIEIGIRTIEKLKAMSEQEFASMDFSLFEEEVWDE